MKRSLSAVVSADGYKTVSEYKVVVQNNGDYTLTLTTTSFYDKTQIDAKVASLETAIGEKDTITDLQENKKYSYQYLVNSNGELILKPYRNSTHWSNCLVSALASG